MEASFFDIVSLEKEGGKTVREKTVREKKVSERERNRRKRVRRKGLMP